MKKIILSLALALISYVSFGQNTPWSTSGNIGIGTTSPSSLLDIKGSVYWGSNSTGLLSSDGNGAIELGPNAGSGNVPFIDWHYGIGSYQDFNVRLMNSGDNRFDILTASNGIVFTVSGNSVGIGTTDPQGYKLAVNGNIRAKEIKVETGWSDYVFYKNYHLLPLAEVDRYIQVNQHLPDVPSAVEVKKNGINVGETNALLLKKIEELTLYLIDKDKQVKQLQDEIKNLKQQDARIAALEAALTKLTANSK